MSQLHSQGTLARVHSSSSYTPWGKPLTRRSWRNQVREFTFTCALGSKIFPWRWALRLDAPRHERIAVPPPIFSTTLAERFTLLHASEQVASEYWKTSNNASAKDDAVNSNGPAETFPAHVEHQVGCRLSANGDLRRSCSAPFPFASFSEMSAPLPKSCVSRSGNPEMSARRKTALPVDRPSSLRFPGNKPNCREKNHAFPGIDFREFSSGPPGFPHRGFHNRPGR